jgi:hypothetical protein
LLALLPFNGNENPTIFYLSYDGNFFLLYVFWCGFFVHGSSNKLYILSRPILPWSF